MSVRGECGDGEGGGRSRAEGARKKGQETYKGHINKHCAALLAVHEKRVSRGGLPSEKHKIKARKKEKRGDLGEGEEGCASWGDTRVL